MSDDNYRLEKRIEKIEEVNARWANRLENAVRQERRRINDEIDTIQEIIQGENVNPYYALEMLRQELRGEVENPE